MKSFILLIALSIVATITWFSLGGGSLSGNDYISEKILDMARPLDVTIDIEFLSKLTPAYEQ